MLITATQTHSAPFANGASGDPPPPHQHEPGGCETWMGTNKVQKDASVILVRNQLEMLEELPAE